MKIMAVDVDHIGVVPACQKYMGPDFDGVGSRWSLVSKKSPLSTESRMLLPYIQHETGLFVHVTYFSKQF